MGRKTVPEGNEISYELALSNSEDQPAVVSKTALEQAISFSNTILDRSIKEKNPDIALKLLDTGFALQQLSESVSTHVCYHLRKRWKEYAGDISFTDYAFLKVGRSHSTLNRLADVGEWIEERVPTAELRELFKFRPVRNLIPIVQAEKRRDEPFTVEEYRRLAMAVNGSEVREILGELLQTQRKPTNRLVLYIDREGTLVACRRNQRAIIGYLKIAQDDLVNPLVAEAVQRVIASTGILEAR